MKKTLLGVLSAAALVAVVLVPLAGSNNGAIVIKDGGCGVLDGDGGFAIATGDITVQNHGGNTILVCKVKDVPNSTGKAVHWDFDNTGISCGTSGGPTTDWHETVSASGNVTLVCKVEKP